MNTDTVVALASITLSVATIVVRHKAHKARMAYLEEQHQRNLEAIRNMVIPMPKFTMPEFKI